MMIQHRLRSVAFTALCTFQGCNCGAEFVTVKDDAGFIADGEEGGNCYPNATCNGGLVCLSNLCVSPGEGEGELAGEGEGDAVGEGEGDAVGEGEGDAVGEGEGDIGEGEGDGAGEGEGEGESSGEGEGDAVGEGEGDSACSPDGGTLDLTFGGAGFVVHDGAPGRADAEYADAVAIDAQGRIIIAGNGFDAGGAHRMVVWAYLPTGELDLSFGAEGVFVDFGVSGALGRAVAIAANGDIVVAGSGTASDGETGMVVWRLAPDGELDTTFSGDGRFFHQGAGGRTGPSTQSTGFAVAIDSVGRIVVAGESTAPNFNSDAVVWRLLDTGGLDLDFNSTGVRVVRDATGGSGTDSFVAVAVTADDSVVVNGFSLSTNLGHSVLVARVLASGALDQAFDGDGLVTIDNLTGSGADADELGRELAIDASGRILVSAYASDGIGFHHALVRLQGDGALDPSFGDFGIVHGNGTIAGGNIDIGGPVIVDALNRITLLGGSRNDADQEAPVAWRFLDDGSPDPCFADGVGFALLDVPNALDPPGNKSSVYRAVTDAAGRIVTVGARAGATTVDMVAYRVLTD